MFRIWILLSALVFVACSTSKSHPTNRNLASISIKDRNGISESVRAKDRLERYQKLDFAQSQPYEKVLRVYSPDRQGHIDAIVTSYHPNGQLHQYLEVRDSRAFGMYQEWYRNGKQKAEAHVIGGQPDIEEFAKASWLFDGPTTVWDEFGHLVAVMPYHLGKLEGESLYYYPSGQLHRRLSYKENLLEGDTFYYDVQGRLRERSLYVAGKRHGLTEVYGEEGQVIAQETYRDDLLEEATYCRPSGELLASIRHGDGTRVIFNEQGIYQKEEYHNGVLDGNVQVFDARGALSMEYGMKDEVKHGVEWVYYAAPTRLAAEKGASLRPKLSVEWYKGVIQGVCKSWYDNGVLQSQRTFADNKKSGSSTFWYKNGKLMMLEHYEKDALQSGEYYQPDSPIPVSRVVGGNGVASLFDEEGRLIRKVIYRHGKPSEL